MNLAETLVMDYEYESVNTRKMLEIAPADRFDWKPHEKSKSVGMLASHLAETPTWISSMMEDEMDFGAMEDYQPFLAKDPDELLTAFDKNLADGLDFIRDKVDAFLSRTWTMKMGDKILMQQPKHGVIKAICIHHTIHHRGQLSVYLRMLDVPLPSIYGPTADNPSF